jgi:hypothetical protein
MTEKVEYLYRYRSWDSGCYYGVRDKDSIDVAGAWDEWRFCDENKYNEICDAIRPPYPNHYQAEKMLVTIVEAESFDPHAWIEDQKAQAAAARQRVNPHATGPGNTPVYLARAMLDSGWTQWFVVAHQMFLQGKTPLPDVNITSFRAAMQSEGFLRDDFIDGVRVKTFTFHEPDPHENEMPKSVSGANSFASSSSMSSADAGGILDGIGTIGRVVMNAIADGASSVVDGIGDMCD